MLSKGSEPHPSQLNLAVLLLTHQPGDSISDIAKRVSIIVSRWGGFIGLLIRAGYARGDLHGACVGIGLFCGFFALAVLKAPDFLGSRRSRGH